MIKGLQKMSDSLSDKFYKEGYRDIKGNRISKEKVANIILSVIDEILSRLDNNERVFISKRCVFRKYSKRMKFVEFKDLREGS